MATLGEPAPSVETLSNPDLPPAEAQKVYSRVAHQYDKVMVEKFGWSSTLKCLADGMQKKLGDQKDQRILDIGAGTGLLGQELAKYGYTGMDALDLNAEMLQLAKEKNVYKNLICARLGDPLPIKDNTYDAVVGAGVYWPGSTPPSCFAELIRILKPGGLFVATGATNFRDAHPTMSAYFQFLTTKLQEHVDYGDWVMEDKEFIEHLSAEGEGYQYYYRKSC